MAVWRNKNFKVVKSVTKENNNLAFLFKMDRLSITDVEILNYLYRYKYLSRAYLEILLKKDIQKKLNKLVKNGVIRRTNFEFIEDGEVRHTPYIYSLLKSSLVYILKTKRISNFSIMNYLQIDTMPTVLNYLLVNQFLVTMYADISCEVYSAFKLKKSKNKAYNYLGYVKIADIGLFLVPIAVTRGDKDYMDYISVLKENYSQNFDFKGNIPAIVLICEDDEHIKDVALECYTEKVAGNLYFTTDARLNSEELKNSLVTCVIADDKFVMRRILLNRR